jgi:hypothetical protein
MPLVLQKFILATGERGIGYSAVFGPQPMTAEQFQLLFYCQQRTILASTEEGRKDISASVSIRRAIEMEEREAQGIVDPYRDMPMDFERMTPEQLEAWRAYQAQNY